MQAVTVCSSFFLECLEKGQSPLGVRGGLVFPLLSWPLVHVCFLTSAPWPCYAVLTPRTQNKDICPRRVLPNLPCGPFSSPIPLFLTACPCQPPLLAPWLLVFETCSQPLAPSLLQGCLYRCVAAECEVSQKILGMGHFRYPCSPRAAQPSKDKGVTVEEPAKPHS